MEWHCALHPHQLIDGCKAPAKVLSLGDDRQAVLPSYDPCAALPSRHAELRPLSPPVTTLHRPTADRRPKRRLAKRLRSEDDSQESVEPDCLLEAEREDRRRRKTWRR